MNQRTEELLAPAASDCVSGVRLKRSEETFIINRRGRSTHPEKKSVLRSGATPAAALRAEHGLRTPDAIHVATAIKSGASAIVTNDASWRRLPSIPVVTLQSLRRDQDA